MPVPCALESVEGVLVPSASRVQHAIRLLALLHQAGEAAGKPGDPSQAVRAVRSELRLQALDFWLRNPDYLADELVTEVEAGRLDDAYLAVAASLLTDPEPSLRHYPMPRWLFGAYEPLDDAFAPPGGLRSGGHAPHPGRPPQPVLPAARRRPTCPGGGPPGPAS